MGSPSGATCRPLSSLKLPGSPGPTCRVQGATVPSLGSAVHPQPQRGARQAPCIRVVLSEFPEASGPSPGTHFLATQAGT